MNFLNLQIIKAVAAIAIFGMQTGQAISQVNDIELGIESDRLALGDDLNCQEVASELDGRSSGAQWLVGDGIRVFPLATSRNEVITVSDAFALVNCYAEAGPAGNRRVFVATEDLSSCGWVNRSDLLDEHRREKLSAFQRGEELVCEPARPMPLSDFCTKLTSIDPNADSVCQGTPTGLRAKGVLLGTDSEARRQDVVFRSAPDGGETQPNRTFFSVMEIHEVEMDEKGAPAVLVGDGEGTLFGWVALRHLEIWPTRLGLFYDAEGKGYLFSELEDLITNWRDGAPAPNIRPGLPPDQLRDYVHGGSQLLSYPIVRTVDPMLDIFADPDDPAYHEVIFLGRSTTNAAADLVAQAELAGRLDALQQINVMIVVDTTESMRPYLPLVRQGISDFISQYREDRQNPALRLPDMRLAVYAYSDFQRGNATGLNDPIDTKTLMPPRALDSGVDLSGPLEVIRTHKGLDDNVGLREEAAFEAVVQMARRFEDDAGWFPDGPRFVIHLADHGSRASLDMDLVQRELYSARTKYIPLSIVTKDETDAARAARKLLEQQALEALRTFRAVPKAGDIFTVDLIDFETKTPEVVGDGLRFLTGAVTRTVREVRATGGGGDTSTVGGADAYDIRNRAASQIELSDRLRAEFGLDDLAEEEVLQAATTGFAPLAIKERGLEQDANWTYTVALDPKQADVLAQSLDDLCQAIGQPGQEAKFIALIVRLARAFSGDEVQDLSDLYAILADVGDLPGADKSFLAVQPRVLRDRIESADPEVAALLRRDVCWTSYHFTNMRASLYAQPNQLVWTGREFDLKNGELATKRNYSYRPVIGAETVFVPGFFFVIPSQIEDEEGEGGFDEFFDR